MKKIIATAIVLACLTSYGQVKHQTSKHVVLPNPKLLGCVSSDCSQLWQDKPPDTNDIYPKQVVVDLLHNDYCPSGVMAHYDKSVSMEDLKAAIDARYGKWAVADFNAGSVMLWRVVPEKFAIQLAALDKRDERREGVEAGTKNLVYLSIDPKKCGSQ